MLIRHGFQGRARGHLSIAGPTDTVEFETFTCAHCSRIIKIPHRAAPDEVGGRCGNCDAMVCPGCVRIGRCTPFEKKLEEYEARQRFLVNVG